MDDETLTLDRVVCDPDVAAGESSSDDRYLDADSDEQIPMSDQHEEQPLEAEATPAAAEPEAAARKPGELSPASVIEALLFSADTPLSLHRLVDLSGGTPTEVRLHIADLNDRYAAAGLSFRVQEIAKGYQMMTEPEFAECVSRLNHERAQSRLTGAALETVSIIAYKQPIIRADIEAIRGVACGEVINRLREMGLVKIIGRAEVVGRPLLYGTTRKFLDVFGLADLDDLPPMEALAIRRAPASEATQVDDAADENDTPPRLAASA